jgi:hypothetical protein
MNFIGLILLMVFSIWVYMIILPINVQERLVDYKGKDKKTTQNLHIVQERK